MSDRRVHGITSRGGEIVRYERAGKWYVEWPNGKPRRAISIGTAALLACEDGGDYRLGLPGGGAFDRAVARTMQTTPLNQPGASYAKHLDGQPADTEDRHNAARDSRNRQRSADSRKGRS